MKTRLPPELFGDALMVLEFLHAFGELFDLNDEFPDGVTLGKIHTSCSLINLAQASYYSCLKITNFYFTAYFKNKF